MWLVVLWLSFEIVCLSNHYTLVSVRAKRVQMFTMRENRTVIGSTLGKRTSPSMYCSRTELLIGL